MALRTGHGKGVGRQRIETLPADELPAPVPDEAAPLNRRQNGTLADSESARRLGARGGAAKASRARLASALGLAELSEEAAFRPYRDAGDAWVRDCLASLAVQAGGEVGPGPASMIANAGVMLAASRFFSDRGMAEIDPGLLQIAKAMSAEQRQQWAMAYELAVREAQARPKLTGIEGVRKRLMAGVE